MIELRLRRRWGADHIAHETGLAASTVQNILNRAGLGRLDRGDRTTAPGRQRRRCQRQLVRAWWKRVRKVAIWALVTDSDGEKVPGAVPWVIPRADMHLMLSAWVELAGTSLKEAAPEVGQSRPAALQARAMNAAIWALVTDSDGEKVLDAVPAMTPKADMQSMPDVWPEPGATSSKYANPEVGQSRPATSQVRAMNVAIWALVTDSDGEKVLAEVPTVILSLATVAMLSA